MVVIDTSIIIDHLRQANPTVDTTLMKFAAKEYKANLSIATVSIQELYEGLSTRDLAKEDYLLATIAPLKILSYTYEVAQLAGELARDLKNPIEFADAAIAATVIVNGAELLTLNKRHFSNIPNLDLCNLP